MVDPTRSFFVLRYLSLNDVIDVDLLLQQLVLSLALIIFLEQLVDLRVLPLDRLRGLKLILLKLAL